MTLVQTEQWKKDNPRLSAEDWEKKTPEQKEQWRKMVSDQRLAKKKVTGAEILAEHKVFLGNISYMADKKAITEFVKQFGNPCKITNTGKAFSFVKFETAEEMQPFVVKLIGKELCGQAVRAMVSCGTKVKT